MTSAAAPGKIILFGEHAVVYGQPALAVPVQQVQMRVDIVSSSRAGIHIKAPAIGLSSDLNRLEPGDAIASVIQAVYNRLGKSASATQSGIEINIQSTIPVAAGLGSGAAVSVALIRALSAHLGERLSNEQVNQLAFEAEKRYHGTPSGIDNTVITYARPVYFVKGQPGETFTVKSAFWLVIGDTGVAASTRETVADVRRLWQANPPKMERIFAVVGSLVRTARQLIENGQPELLGPLMNENHELLQELTVSSAALDDLVAAAKRAGALGAKLSGGGRGGNMIALVHEQDAGRVEQALRAAGAKNTIATRVQ